MAGSHNMDGCNLHIPHKSWVRESENDVSLGERLERENWSELERWANERLPNCGCSCFYEHRSHVSTAVALKTYTILAPTSTFTIGNRNGWLDTRTTMLVVDWSVNISDYSDGTAADVEYGFGCIVDQQNQYVGGSHGFIHRDNLKNFWVNGITGVPAGVTTDDLTSGSFTCFLNGPQSGPIGSRWNRNVGVYLGISNPGAGLFATFHVETYEYGMCSCNGQE